MRELTLKQLENAQPFEVMETGVVTEPQLANEPVRWVAVRGGAPDWAIYYHREANGIEFAKEQGDKVTTANLIQNLVPCTQEALSRYRL